MSILYRCNTITQRSQGSDTDGVIAWAAIPPGGKLVRSGVEVSITGGEQSVQTAQFYGMSGQVVPVVDPDAAENVNDLWDLMVAKAKPLNLTAGTTTIDMDTIVEDTDPEYQLSENKWEEMINGSLGQTEFMRRRGMVTFAKNPVGFREIDSAIDLYVPTEYFRKMSNKVVKVDKPSYALVGFSNPTTTSTQTTVATLNTVNEWFQLQYLQDTLVDAMKQMVGLTEPGAESPYTFATTLIKEVTQPLALELTSGAFVNANWNIFCRAFFDIEVPGELRVIGMIGDE